MVAFREPKLYHSDLSRVRRCAKAWATIRLRVDRLQRSLADLTAENNVQRGSPMGLHDGQVDSLVSAYSEGREDSARRCGVEVGRGGLVTQTQK